MDYRQIALILRLARPLYLVVGGLLYALGAGIAHYLGEPVGGAQYALGQIWISSLQLSFHFLTDYFDRSPLTVEKNANPFRGGSGALGEDRLPRPTGLWAGLGAMTTAAAVTLLLLRGDGVPSETLAVMVLIFVAGFLYTIPPVRLAETGYGELVLSIWMANLVPAFGFLLQTGAFHRLLPMTTFPLVALHLNMILAYDFASFAKDVKYEVPTLLYRMGWRSGLTLHNLLVLTAFVLLGLAATLGLPPSIALPGFLTLPLGLLAIWQMVRIGAGARPNWRAFTLTAVTLFIVTTYLLTYSFWTR